MDILHCFLCIFPRYSKTYSSAAVKPLTVFFWLRESPNWTFAQTPIASSSSPCRLSFHLHLFFSKNLKDCLLPTSISISVGSVFVLCICRVGKQLMAFVDLPEWANDGTPPARPPVMFRQLPTPLEQDPRCSPDQGRISVAPSPLANMGGRARSGCSSNPALVISQLMSSPCYLSVETHGFAATASVAAIF